MKTKMFISGAITGDPNYKEHFHKAEEDHKKLGYIILNPAELPQGMNPEDYMKVCLAMISISDVVLFLKGHECSAGSEIEYKYAKYAGKAIVYEEETE